MTSIDLDKSVADWAIDYPASVAVFEAHGIDYCCGGKSLEHACRQTGANLSTVAAQLARIVAATDGPAD